MIEKIRDGYFANGVQSAWLVLPAIRSITLCQPGQLATSLLRDPVTGIELDIDRLFR